MLNKDRLAEEGTLSRTWQQVFLPQLDPIVLPTPYLEVWKIDNSDFPLPIKQNYRGAQLIGEALLAYPVFSKNYLDRQDTPSFAQGRCIQVGGGDYKTVMVDNDGKSDMVFKLYHQHIYSGKHAREEAVAAAKKISQIHEIAEVITPGFVLPSEMLVDEADGYFFVYERQQRASIVNINLFDPRTAERLHKEAMDACLQGTKAIEEELLKRGLSRRSRFSNMITDDFALTEIHWDALTNHLVSLDIVDEVDITPMFRVY